MIGGCNGHVERKLLAKALPVNTEARFRARCPFDNLPKARGRLRSRIAALTERCAPNTICSCFGQRSIRQYGERIQHRVNLLSLKLISSIANTTMGEC